MSQKQRWIIDTDPGCDDMMAILYLINRPEVELEFISLSEGNCKMEDVQRNIKKIIKISEKQMTVYSGCYHQLYNGALNAYDYHYEDGLGNIEEIKKIDVSDVNISEKSSSVEIVKAVNKHPNQINILILGPLTNLIAAYMLDPSINSKFKNIVVMGGSYKWRGNVTSVAEFNFYHDFIAVKSFLTNFKNALITGWEPTEFLFFNVNNLAQAKEIAVKTFGGFNESIYKYLFLIIEKYTNKREGTQVCDLYAIISFFEQSVVKKYFLSKADIVLDSDALRGGLILYEKEYPQVDFKDIFIEYYQKNKEYSVGKNIFIEELCLERIIEQFAYILKPN